PAELYRASHCTQAPINLKRSPFAQMRRLGKCSPHFLRLVAQLSRENKRPHLSVLPYLRPAGRTRCVLLAIGHFSLLVLSFIRVEEPSPIRSRWRSRASRKADQNRRN